MKIHLSSQKSESDQVDICALICFEGEFKKEKLFQELNKSSQSLLERWVDAEHFAGKKGQTLCLQLHNNPKTNRILLVGVGRSDAFQPSHLRTLAVRIIKMARSMSATKIAMRFPRHACVNSEQASCFAAEGTLLGGYVFDKYHSDKKKKEQTIQDVYLRLDVPASAPVDLLSKAVQQGKVIAEMTALARDWVNEPPNYMTPSRMASLAQECAKKYHLSVRILSKKECEKKGMGLLLGVGKGSAEEPCLIHLSYKPRKKKPKKCVALIGKSVTFDTGGYAIKTLPGMIDMKTDMAGGATVLAAIAALAQLDCPVEVHAVLPAVENMVSGGALRPSDVLVSMAGRTVEVNNPDAEGRLTLADAITYIQKESKPDEIIDLATLTGACVAALGPSIAGLMSNHDGFAERFLQVAKRCGEDMWHLPLPERLRDSLNSDVADMRNTGSDRNGGALIAGLFIREFVEKSTSWIHIDIAGPACTDKEWGPYARGGTGFGVSTLVHYLSDTSSESMS